MKSWIAPQLNNYIEGNYIDKDLKKMISLIDLGFKRFKRIISFFEIFLAFLKDIIHNLCEGEFLIHFLDDILPNSHINQYT